MISISVTKNALDAL